SELNRIRGRQRDLQIGNRSEQESAQGAGGMRADSCDLAAVVDGCRNFQCPALVRINYRIQISHDPAAVNKRVVSRGSRPADETCYFSESVDGVSAALEASGSVQVCHRAP